jgi:hypothetical protein
MSKLKLNITMSIDGYVAGRIRRPSIRSESVVRTSTGG